MTVNSLRSANATTASQGQTATRAPNDLVTVDPGGIDPLLPPDEGGWAPSTIRAVRSRNEGGIVGSTINFALGGVTEAPGQRLSTAQVDAVAPFFAATYGLDEGYVRQELAKVYLYVGGPAASSGQAMTIGHHVYMPDAKSLDTILDRRGRAWLVHELAHTMQFLANDGASPHRFLAGYIKSWFVGINPERPGTAEGPRVWGGAFTALRSAGKTEGELEADDELGAGAKGLDDRLVSSVLPAGALALTVGGVAAGALSATRATTGSRILGTARSLPLAGAAIVAPALIGAGAGMWGDITGSGIADTIGVLGGGAIAGAALWRSGAFRAGTSFGQTGRAIAIGGAGAVVVGAAAIGGTSAQTSVNTVRGWSDSAATLHALTDRSHDGEDEPISYQSALHDSLWEEIDAEAAARQWMAGDPGRTDVDTPVGGRNPDVDGPVDDPFTTDLGDRLDWGLQIPLVLGVPAAVAAGTGVLAARTGRSLFDETIRDGRPLGQAIRVALEQLGSRRLGVRNSLAVGAAVTLAPLVVGGSVGPLVQDASESSLGARLAGAGAGAAAAGILLPMLLTRRGGGIIGTTGTIAGGTLISAGLGFLSGGVAADALHPRPRVYDRSGG